MAEDTNENVDPVSAGGQAEDVGEAVDDALAQAQAAVDQLQEETDDDDDAGEQGDDAAISEEFTGIDMLGDVDLHVTIELGRTQMLVEDVLKLGAGAVVELDKLAGDPVDVFVNDCLIARGEVLVLNDNFCIRISEIVENLEEHAQAAARAQVGAA
jgi:flagellar motor switch protein FliN/FliY